MIITVLSHKGGVTKTTTSVHLARFLHDLAPTLLLDGDETRNALAWNARGAGFPFRVAEVELGVRLGRQYEHVVIDTGQRQSDNDIRAAVKSSDLLIVPATPGTLDTDGLGKTIAALNKIPGVKYKVLLSRVPPDAAAEVVQLRAALASAGAEVFAGEIPRLKAFERAVDAGVTVDQVLSDRQAPRAWAAYQAIGKELIAWA